MGFFKRQLASYKQLSGLTSNDPDIFLQSLSADAYNLLFAGHGNNLTSQIERHLLDNIQALMVRPENKLSHVVRLQRMKPDSGQAVANLSASTRALVRRCHFLVTCECAKVVSYEDHIALY